MLTEFVEMKTVGTRQKAKSRGTTQGRDTTREESRVETSNLPDRVFKVMIVKMLTELKERRMQQEG